MPWPLSAGKPWHQLVLSRCHAGIRVPSYVRMGLRRDLKWLRSLVGPNGASILALAPSHRQAAAADFRNRKSARAAQRSTGLTAVIIAITPMVVSLSDASRRDRAHHHEEWFDVKTKVNLLAC